MLSKHLFGKDNFTTIFHQRKKSQQADSTPISNFLAIKNEKANIKSGESKFKEITNSENEITSHKFVTIKELLKVTESKNEKSSSSFNEENQGHHLSQNDSVSPFERVKNSMLNNTKKSKSWSKRMINFN